MSSSSSSSSAATNRQPRSDEELRAEEESHRRQWDVQREHMQHRGKELVARLCAYDRMASFIVSRNTHDRRSFVGEVRRTLRQRYSDEFTNEDDEFARQQFDQFFAAALGPSAVAEQLQMFCIHWAILIEEDVHKWFCSDVPDPDAEGDAAIDQSRVDRVAFKLYRQRLVRMYDDIRAGRKWSVGSFVREINTYYTSLMPPDPLAAVCRSLERHPRSARRVEFLDAEAQRAVAAALKGGGGGGT
jgi:hypothetical protein